MRWYWIFRGGLFLSSCVKMATSWDVICFIGLGNMGSAMVERIVESGVVKKLIVWNRTPEKAEKVGKLGSSVTVAGDMQEVVKLLEAEAGEKKSLHLMLTGDEATAEILEGMFRAGLTDQVVVNHATISQMAAKECGERCRQTGNRYITATVTGRPPAARAGTLAIWLSCDDDKSISDLKQIKADLLPSLARSIQVISETDVTKAITFKLLTNFLLYASAEVFAETTVMFEQNGLDRTLLTVMKAATKKKRPRPYTK